MSEEKKFSECEEGKKNVSVEFRVFGKKENWKKSSGEKMVLDENFKVKVAVSEKS